MPILKYEWLEHLTGRTEAGLKLRTKEEAAKYLLDGEMPEDLPLVPKEQKRKEAEPSAVRTCTHTHTHTSVTFVPDAVQLTGLPEGESAPKKKQRRAPISGEILKVDPDSGHVADGKIWVAEDVAYHAMCTQTDISTVRSRLCLGCV